MFGAEFWRSLRAEHVLLLLGWVIGGAVFWADTRSTFAEHGRDIAKLQREQLRDNEEATRQQRELSASLADIKARLGGVADAVTELKGDVRRGWGGARP